MPWLCAFYEGLVTAELIDPDTERRTGEEALFGASMDTKCSGVTEIRLPF